MIASIIECWLCASHYSKYFKMLTHFIVITIQLLPPYYRWLKYLVHFPFTMVNVEGRIGTWASPRASHGHGLYDLLFCFSQLEYGFWYLHLKKFWLIYWATWWMLLLLTDIGNSGEESFSFGRSKHRNQLNVLEIRKIQNHPWNLLLLYL